MIIKLSLDEENLQMPCVHVKQESREALKFGEGHCGLTELICHVWQKSNSYGGVIKSGEMAPGAYAYDMKQLQLTLIMM